MNKLRANLPDEFDFLFEPQEWRRQAACGATDIPRWDLFFTDDVNNQLEAKVQYCASCPVAFDCLDTAIRNREVFGVWGGMTFAERIAFTDRHGRDHTSSVARLDFEHYLNELNKRKKLRNAHRTTRMGRRR